MPSANSPDDCCVHELFEAQAARVPDAIAVACAGRLLTYRALDYAAARLAGHLRRRGVKPDSCVGLLGDRSPEIVIGLMAILKAGGSYVPLEPSHPPARLARVIEDSHAAVILAARSAGALVPGRVASVCIEDACEQDSEECSRFGWAQVRPANSATVIYTSGTTGEPKGIHVTHGAIVSRIRNGYAYRAGDLQKSRVSVVAHFSDVLLPLACGAPVVIVPDRDVTSIADLARTIARERTTRTVFVPSQLAALLQGGPDVVADLKLLDAVIASGEAVGPALLRTFRAALPGTDLLNSYGASEAAGLVCVGEISRSDRITVGVPQDGTEAYIVNDKVGLAAVGETGEVCFAGPRLARGYVGRPALTAERFVANPFAGVGERMYRTGDLGRVMADGNFDLTGRADDEVKVRGFRVNPIEVEAVLEQHGSVDRAVVIPVGSEEDLHLTAYIVPRDGREGLQVAALRRQVADTLPAVMVPSRFVLVTSLPLLLNGKVDRLRLAEAGDVGPDTADTAPRMQDQPGSPTVATIARLWADVLNVPAAGPDDDFFALGGDSIRAMKIVTRAAARGLSITLQQIVENPRLEDLARVIDLQAANVAETTAAITRPV